MLTRRLKYRGIAVGGKEDFIRLNEFLEQHKVALTPIIDRVFPFSESRAACEYLYSGQHVGKVVIKI